MGPWTRAIRIVFAAAFGAMAGFVVSMVANTIWHQTVAEMPDPDGPAASLAVVVVVGLMVLGAAIGAAIGAARRKKTYHDES